MDKEKPNENELPIDSNKDLIAFDLFEEMRESGASTAEALKFACAEYPDFAIELCDYAISSDLADSLPESPELDALQAKIIGLSDKLSQSRFRVQSETQKPIEGILAAAKAIGISIAELSQNLGLAKSALIKLDRRLIDASTVPQKAIEKIAAAVSVSAESLRAYLNAPPTLGAGASYHSIDKPSLLSSNSVEMREPFESTLQTSISSGEMTREQAEEWL